MDNQIKHFKVLSKTHVHFLDFIKKYRLPRHLFSYINDEHSLRGIHRDSFVVIKYGNYHEKDRIDQIMDIIHERKCILMTEKEFINYLYNHTIVTPGNQPPKE